MPCEQGVQIVPVTIFKSLALRLPPESVVKGGLVEVMQSLENCVQCRECEKKCPYELDILDMLQENLDYYNGLPKKLDMA